MFDIAALKKNLLLKFKIKENDYFLAEMTFEESEKGLINP